MMIKENSKICKAVSKIRKGHEEIFDTLDKLLSRTDKVFKITIDKKEFEFIPPSDKTDERIMSHFRYQCIKTLLSRSYKKLNSANSYNKEHAYNDILALTMGPDPRDLQFEKYEVQDSYEVHDGHVEDTGASKAITLNIENWQVRQELTEDAKNFNPITRKSFDEEG